MTPRASRSRELDDFELARKVKGRDGRSWLRLDSPRSSRVRAAWSRQRVDARSPPSGPRASSSADALLPLAAGFGRLPLATACGVSQLFSALLGRKMN